MSDSTDRVLASIDEAIDGYVSEDWAVSGDAMRWQPEEPKLLQATKAYLAPMGTLADGPEAWTELDYATEHAIVHPPDDGGVDIRPWRETPVVEVWIRTQLDASFELAEFQRTFLNQIYASDHVSAGRERRTNLWSNGWRSGWDGAWCASTWLDELHDGRVYVEGGHSVDAGGSSRVEPHWDDSLVASLKRTREAGSEHREFGPDPVVVARTARAIADALQAEPEPDEKPLTATWNVDAGHVSTKRRNGR